MQTSQVASTSEKRHVATNRPELSGITVREDDVEPVRGIRSVVVLFRGMAVLLLLLTVVQVVLGLTSTVPLSMGVVFAQAVRLIIFAGLLWGGGDLAKLAVKSHYDLRATRILVARVDHMVRHLTDTTGANSSPNSAHRDPNG
jgi:hypothetical protein